MGERNEKTNGNSGCDNNKPARKHERRECNVPIIRTLIKLFLFEFTTSFKYSLLNLGYMRKRMNKEINNENNIKKINDYDKVNKNNKLYI